MKIALIGYGKMGKAIEQFAIAAGNEIALKIGTNNLAQFTIENLQQADVAIEFTQAESAVQNIECCFKAGVPVVCGSTGWLQHYDQIKNSCEKSNGSFLYASNFSVGVQLFFALNRQLAKLMNQHPEYNISLKEIHHTQKKDAPSGTAISLAEQIIEEIPLVKNWVNSVSEKKENLGIVSERKDPAPGTHLVTYNSVIDSIEIIHTAHNRDGFAKGALLAAEFIKNKKGIYNMQDVLAL